MDECRSFTDKYGKCVKAGTSFADFNCLVDVASRLLNMNLGRNKFSSHLLEISNETQDELKKKLIPEENYIIISDNGADKRTTFSVHKFMLTV